MRISSISSTSSFLPRAAPQASGSQQPFAVCARIRPAHGRALTDTVSAETGVPTQATSALAGVVAATLFSIVKRHFLLAQCGMPQLPMLLRDQVAEIKASLSNGVATAIGVGNTEGFTNSIQCTAGCGEFRARRAAGRGDALFGHCRRFRRASAHSRRRACFRCRPTGESAGSLVPARASVRKPAPKRSNKWIWLLFTVLAAILGFEYYHGFTHGDSVSLNARLKFLRRLRRAMRLRRR